MPGCSSATEPGSGVTDGSQNRARRCGPRSTYSTHWDAFPGANAHARSLRASGEQSRERAPAARDQLSTQELQIAQMAATGMTNREIGQQLYLSPRTVGSHLYRLFPKLGVTSRNQLGAALGGADESPAT